VIVKKTSDINCDKLNNLFMKIKNLSIVALGALVVVFSACSVTKRHYAPGYHVEWHKNYKGTEQVAQVKKEKATVNVVEEMVAMNEVAAPVVVAEVAAPAVVMAPVAVEEVAVVTPKQNRVINAIAKKVANVASNVASPVNAEVSIEASASNGFMPEWYHWAMVILGFFPAFMFWMAIFQKNDIPWKEVIISTLLYCLCWIPGIIYSIKWMKREF
jgi:uncharacterized membrane protein YqaE (UPF0057 family)